ncbi:ABC-type nitrate/sulfonate/bicarbonate transport system, permease component [Devosia crocina]|uniref:ABC-type nitrate/sulfonate/bicarbonate transport system, permease component n=1 Tax=Devosia crocina TaxID=429728 RepID=A0A1I7N121_9HYPH|nr:ABC transporter permease subunit [Devosia crocina]SFV28334.1 ABC-type nitrate/sulfonate/bicarbonate transport system, permease component [Devosia crocina]
MTTRTAPFSPNALPTLFAACVLIALWQALASATADMFVFAGPLAVLGAIAEEGSLLLRSSGITLQSAAIGFFIGNVAAILLAGIALALPRLEQLVSGLALVFFCLPFVATGPILRVIFGVGDGPQITLAALATYYTTYLCLLVGLRATPGSWLDLVRSYGRGRLSELIHVRAMASLPYFIAGLQIGAPAAFLGAMVGEFTGAERGLGVLSIRAMRGLDVEMTWAIATTAAALSAAAFWLFGWLGRCLGAGPPPLLLASRQDGPSVGMTARTGSGLIYLILLILAVLGVWIGLIKGLNLSPFFAKGPQDVWAFLVSDPAAATNRAALFTAFWQTLSLTIPGYLVGLALGAGLAVLLVTQPRLASATLPIAIALRSIPIVTTAPLFVLALGRGAVGTITIVAVMIFFPTLAACLEGMRRTPRPVLDLFSTYAASPWQRLAHAQLPAMAPAFFASARMAVPSALLAATTAEWLATGTGMGSLMALTASTSNYNLLWSAIVVLAVTASLIYALVHILEQRVLHTFASEQLVQ